MQNGAVAETDVLVIGAGIFGCSIAYFLSRLGRDVILVDAADIGAGASGANAGNLHLQISPFSHANKGDDWIKEFARILPFFSEAVALWASLAQGLDTDIELRTCGGIMVAETDRQLDLLRHKVSLERANGLNVELLAGQELRRLAPYIAPHVIGASFCAAEGMANSLTSVIALSDAARRNGARVLLHSAVQRLESRPQGWIAWTPHGSIRSRNVVLATGSSSMELAAQLGVPLPLTQRDIQIVATEASGRFIEHLVYHCEERLTLKQAVNGNVIIGGGWSARRDEAFKRPAVLRESLYGSLRIAKTIVPKLAGLCAIRSWAGPNVYTPDGRPIIGAVPGHPGLYYAICNTYGFTLGPLCGLLVAEAVAGKPSSIDIAPYSIGRFSRSTLTT